MAQVTFDGPNKLIIVNNGVTTLDVKVDLYSDWKEWVLLSDNSKYVPAMSVIGGEPIGGGLYAGSLFFIENGWKIRPYEGDHQLSLVGSLFTTDGSSVSVPTLGDFTVTVKVLASNLAQGIETSSGGLTPEQEAALLKTLSLVKTLLALNS